jgi:hypothetical protein
VARGLDMLLVSYNVQQRGREVCLRLRHQSCSGSRMSFGWSVWTGWPRGRSRSSSIPLLERGRARRVGVITGRVKDRPAGIRHRAADRFRDRLRKAENDLPISGADPSTWSRVRLSRRRSSCSSCAAISRPYQPGQTVSRGPIRFSELL